MNEYNIPIYTTFVNGDIIFTGILMLLEDTIKIYYV